MSTKIKNSKATPKYSWGGVLADTAAGAGTGALAGSVVPGIGTAVGAVIGGAGALLKGAVGEIQGNKEEQLKLSQQKVANATNSFNTMMMGGNQNPFTQMMAYGGRVGMNAEIEKGETAVSPDGRMREFSLPSHANTTGDNFKYFDPGTMIFSDKLKFSKNKTFAQEQLSYKKISDKAEKALKNPGSTFLNKKTANLNKQNSLKMSYDLFGKQEAMKMSKGGRIPKAENGLLTEEDPRFYLGITPITNKQTQLYPPAQPIPSWIGTQGNTNQQQSFMLPEVNITDKRGGTGRKVAPWSNPWMNDMLYADSFAPATLPNVATTNAASPYNEGSPYGGVGMQGLAPMPSYQPNGVQGGGGSGMNWGGIGMQALALAPDIYNLGHALFSKPEKVERNRYFNPYTNQIRSRMNDRRFNIDPMLAANRTANAVYNRNAASASGGDRSRLLSNLMGGLNARYGADANAYAHKNNMDNQYLGEQAEMDMNLGNMNARGLMMSDDINARNMAAKRNFGASAASGLQSYALNQMQMKNQMNSQDAYLDVLQRVNPFFNQWMGIDSLRARNKR